MTARLGKARMTRLRPTWFLAVLLFLLAACGGGAAEIAAPQSAPRSPSAAGASMDVAGRSELSSPKKAPGAPQPDHDSDGIPDAQDKRPDDDVIGAHQTAMLVYTAQLTMAVYQVEPGLAAVEKIARDLGGYLASRTDTEITIRVPRAKFDETIRRVGLTGDVAHKSITAQDVTDEYMDLDTRLKNARAMRDRFQELLRRAEVKEAIEIQKELSKVTGEIELIEGRLKLLKDQIAYSTVTVTFQGRGASALRDMPLRLPFPWLSELGLPRLLNLHE